MGYCYQSRYLTKFLTIFFEDTEDTKDKTEKLMKNNSHIAKQFLTTHRVTHIILLQSKVEYLLY